MRFYSFRLNPVTIGSSDDWVNGSSVYFLFTRCHWTLDNCHVRLCSVVNFGAAFNRIAEWLSFVCVWHMIDIIIAGEMSMSSRNWDGLWILHSSDYFRMPSKTIKTSEIWVFFKCYWFQMFCNNLSNVQVCITINMKIEWKFRLIEGNALNTTQHACRNPLEEVFISRHSPTRSSHFQR